MNAERGLPRVGRHIPEDGTIMLWREREGDSAERLLLKVRVCPFPGCPDRHVLVDGFRMDGTVPAEWQTTDLLSARGQRGPAPRLAFAASVDLDSEEVSPERASDRASLKWFEKAVIEDDELREALRIRFERGRAVCDQVLLGDAKDGTAGGDVTTPSSSDGGWTTRAISPDKLMAVLAAFPSGIRGGESMQPMREPRIGRNDPCHCGSGKKYKRCCLGSGVGG